MAERQPGFLGHAPEVSLTPRVAAFAQPVKSAQVSTHSFELKLFPFGRLPAEVGWIKIENLGNITIPFQKSYDSAPAVIITALSWWEVNLLGIVLRIPVPTFLWRVRTTDFTLFTAASSGFVAYCAWQV